MNDIHIPAFTIRKEIILGVVFFIAGALLFTAFSTIATTIGTNVSVTGHLFATSTVQATGNIIGYADLILGTTTPWKGSDYAFEQQAGTQPVFLVGDTGTSTPHFVISAKGNVGIGTTSPISSLEVSSNNAFGQIRSVYTGTPSTGDGTINLLYLSSPPTAADQRLGTIAFGGNNGTDFFSTALVRGLSSAAWSSSVRDSSLVFITTSGTSATEKVRITSSGNVGIGTTTPASLLSLSSSGTTTIHVGTTSTTKGSCFQMYDAAHVAYRAFISKAGAWTVEAGTCE